MKSFSVITAFFKPGWTWIRWLRLVLGSMFLIQGLTQHDVPSGGLGGLLLMQAFIGCARCDAGTCRIPERGPEQAVARPAPEQPPQRE